MKKIFVQILLFALFVPAAIFAETRMKETVYVKKENGKEVIYGMITHRNYHIWGRKQVYVFYYNGKQLIEDCVGVDYVPTRYDTVTGDSIDGEPIWEYTDYSYEREIVFPSDYAFEKLFVRNFWEESFSHSEDFGDFDRFAEILSCTGKSELRLMRNTVYAWYNYPFKSKDLQEIFSVIADYYPDPSVTNDTIENKLSKRDKKILDMIIAEEAR